MDQEVQTAAVAEPSIFSPKGRMGRIKYVALATAFWGAPNFLGPSGVLVAPITLIFYSFMVMKRLRDINVTPWLVIVAFIPLLNLPLAFIPGTNGNNKYGNQPEASSKRYIVWAVILPILLIGFTAANLLPKIPEYKEAFHRYQERN